MRSRPPRAALHTPRALTLALLAFCSTAAFAEVPIPSTAPVLTPVVINASSGDQYDPHLSGDLTSYTSDLEIRYFDFATNLDTAIPMDASARDLLADVSGTRIVFSRVVTGVATAATVFDTATNNTIELDPAPGVTRIGSAIGGDTVAYIDYGLEAHGELVAHDLATSTATRLTNDAASDTNPSVSPSGTVITWEHCATSTSNCNIWQAVNTGAGWAVSVTAATANPEANPDTNGSVVVYDSLRAGNADIFIKPIGGGSEIRLERAGFEANPSIAGDYVLFESRPTLFDTTDIFVYDTISNRVYQLTNTPLVTEQLNDISVLPDGRIRAVWSSDEDGFDQRNIHGATFALPRAEGAWSWGLNSAGQLGDGTLTNRASPVRIAGLTVTALAGGREHSLALLSNGTVWAWGRNDVGQLGDGTNTDRSAPVQVSGLSGVTAIAGGDDHSLALKSDGTLWSWGRNNRGQLGDATFNDSSLPVHVYRLTNAVTGIAAGSEHSLAITYRLDPNCPPILLCVGHREVFGWGEGRLGRLGDGADQTSEIPVQVVGLDDVAAVAAGSAHSLALKLDGTLWSWGLNDNGQLGDGTNANASTPVQVIADPGTAIAARGNHSLAISTTGCPSFACLPVIRVSAWGDNAFGQLGDGTLADSNLPIFVTGLTNPVAIAAGGEFSLAKRTDGSLWAWGSNASGQLGDGTGADSAAPTQAALGLVLAIGAGGSHGLASGTRECADGLDNDRDGKTDWSSIGPRKDYGCASANDPSETGTAACDDGFDNDGDGLFDYRPAGGGDLGCSSHRSTIEAPQCQDGIDNDLALGIDFDGGASANGGSPLAVADPQCMAPTTATEALAVGGCGIGPELAVLLPLLGLARARARRRPTAAAG